MFKMGSSIILACLSIFISEMPVHAQSAPDTVKLVCHELNGSAPSDITGNKLGEIIHFVSLNLKEKTANIDDNSKFKITIVDANFFQIESDVAANADSQTISIDRRDGFLSILNLKVQNGAKVVATSDVLGICGTATTKF